MEDPEAKICPNCKREIPSVNFTIHIVHCARNIRVCPVCKEPVPHAELQDHHDKLHKLLPCKKCGESVCGTDLEDHIRDSCAHTIQSCRYCELELPRRDLPAHEGYCGVRTEQCPECREWVMIKYRQLHLDSNHGFLRLDDDPTPVPKKEPLKTTNLTRPTITKITNLPSSSNGLNRPSTSGGLAGPSTSGGLTRPFASNGLTRPTTSKLDNASQTNGYTRNIINDKPKTEIRYLGERSSNAGGSSNVGAIDEPSSSWRSQPSVSNGIRAPLKRTNDQPQINTDVAATKKVEKNLSISRGAVKKRPAPRPPVRVPAPAPEPALPLPPPLQAALQRQQREDRERRKQNAYNLSVGLPPVLTPAAKLEKLRKMDALQNPPEQPLDYKNRLQGRVWQTPNQEPSGYVLGTPNEDNRSISRGAVKKRPAPRPPVRVPAPAPEPALPLPPPLQAALQRQQREDRERRKQNAYNLSVGLPPVLTPAAKLEKLRKMDALQNPPEQPLDYKNRLQGRVWQTPNQEPSGYVLGTPNEDNRRVDGGGNGEDYERRREEFKNLKPMSPQEFLERFNKMQLRKDEEGNTRSGDRFSEIKSSLRELRRGLNEVTAPYNLNANAVSTANNRDRPRRRSPRASPVAGEGGEGGEGEVRLPCEFCAALVRADDLVQHQTGCRPDLAQFRPAAAAAYPARAAMAHAADTVEHEPVIPCEFCMQSLPVYLISEHQERCGRDSNLLYAD